MWQLETIRRDLDALSDDGLIKREFGGASAQPMGHQPDLAQRQMTAVAGFERIGIMAGNMIRPGDVIMIDAGSTVSQLAPIWPRTRRIAAHGSDQLLCGGARHGRTGGY